MCCSFDFYYQTLNFLSYQYDMVDWAFLIVRLDIIWATISQTLNFLTQTIG